MEYNQLSEKWREGNRHTNSIIFEDQIFRLIYKQRNDLFSLYTESLMFPFLSMAFSIFKCHFNCKIINSFENLNWTFRSVDSMLGANFTSFFFFNFLSFGFSVSIDLRPFFLLAKIWSEYQTPNHFKLSVNILLIDSPFLLCT